MLSKSITKKKTNEIIERELLNSFQENDDVEQQGFNETANNVNKSQEALCIINPYKDVIKTPNKKVIGYIRDQEELFKKFKYTENVFENVDQQYTLTSLFISF